MSFKSIFLSILTVILFWGLAILTVFLFGVELIAGIAGLVVTLVIPPIVMRKAIGAANGFLDRLFAKFVVPVLVLVGLGAILLYYFLH